MQRQQETGGWHGPEDNDEDRGRSWLIGEKIEIDGGSLETVEDMGCSFMGK